MKIETLKHKIIEWITKTSDNALLNTLKSLKDSNTTTEEWYDEMREEEIDSINRGIKNHENGEVLTSKEFWTGYGV